MKIIEFGKNDDTSDGPPEARNARGDGIKVREFQADGADVGRGVATPDSVGLIKIIEYDKQPASGEPRHATRAPAPRSAGAMKIVDFDKKSSRKPADSPRRGTMKIVEFD